MADQEVLWRSALELAADIRGRRLSPVELLEASLRRADQLNPSINALVWRNDDEARAAARRAEKEALAGGELPPFHGVPMPIKDLTSVEGWPITYGSRAAPGLPANRSELVVDAFRRAGFVLTGLTNVPEFGALSVTENLRYGSSLNPWDLTRSPGGSSGGAAAAVAGGIFSVAHANDGGGSVRIPASCCGLVGLKASRGRVPASCMSWEGAAVQGALTRDVADAAAVLDVICGPDPGQWYNAPAPERAFLASVGADPGRLRVAVVEEAPFGLPVDKSCRQAVSKAAATLEALGHETHAAQLEVPGEFVDAFFKVASTGLADYDVDWDKAEPHIQASRAGAVQVNSLEYVRAVHTLQRLSRQMVGLWGRDFDLMLTPTMSILPPPAGSVLRAAHDAAGSGIPALEVLQMTVFVAGFNVTGQPAISLPVLETEEGLPIGVQLVAGPWQEQLLLRVAAQLEQAVPWGARRPPL